MHAWDGVTWIVTAVETAPAGAIWTERALGTYVSYQTAPAAPLERDIVVTLGAPGAACIVSSSHSVYLKVLGDTFRAVEVPAADCPGRRVVAVSGAHPDMRAQVVMPEDDLSPAVTAWVEATTGMRAFVDPDGHGHVPAGSLARLHGTDVQAITVMLEPKGAPSAERQLLVEELLLRRGESVLARVPNARIHATMVLNDRTWAVVNTYRHLKPLLLD